MEDYKVVRLHAGLRTAIVVHDNPSNYSGELFISHLA